MARFFLVFRTYFVNGLWTGSLGTWSFLLSPSLDGITVFLIRGLVQLWGFGLGAAQIICCMLVVLVVFGIAELMREIQLSNIRHTIIILPSYYIHYLSITYPCLIHALSILYPLLMYYLCITYTRHGYGMDTVRIRYGDFWKGFWRGGNTGGPDALGLLFWALAFFFVKIGFFEL